MFKYSTYDRALSLSDLATYADRIKTNCLETGNILKQDGDTGDFITWEQVEDIRKFLIDRQKTIINMNTEVPYYNLEFHKELLKRAVLIGIKYIQPMMDNSIATDSFRQEAFFALCSVARAYNIGVLVENKENECAVDHYFEELFKKELQVKPKFIFNPAEFVKVDAHPFFHRFYRSRLKNDIIILRINDCLFKTKKQVLPGKGNSEIKEMASILLARSFDGWFSIGSYGQGIDPEDVLSHFKESLKHM